MSTSGRESGRRGRTVAAAAACLALGAGITFVSMHPLALAAGVVLLVAFVVLGAFAIAHPADLAARDGHDGEGGEW